MAQREPIRWGILSTANIARSAFLPALRSTGEGVPFAVAGRSSERTRTWAQEHEIEHALTGYDALIEHPRIDAIYIATPNALHAEWTIAALRAGKAVLCEKPLCGTLQETERVIEVACEGNGLLWEAFVFPFRSQSRRLMQLLDDGAIGEVRGVESSFHFQLRNRANVRLSQELAGGALNDVGCYCVRLARMVFRSEALGGTSVAEWAPEKVDESMDGILVFPDDRRLVMSCGMDRPTGTFTRISGTEGEIRLTNPFHPNAGDTIEIRTENESSVERPSSDEPSFSDALRHIHAVLRGEQPPRYLAVDDALGNAIALDILHRSARSGCYERA